MNLNNGIAIDSMIHLIIDTNIYTGNPGRNNAAFKAVKRLAIANALKLYIPYFVKWEFLTQEIKNFKDDFSRVDKGLNGVLRRDYRGNFRIQLDNIKQQVSAIYNQMKKYPIVEFSRWAADLGAEFLPIGYKHDRKVARDYFMGAVPFKAIKNRNDIPDAFIWQATKDIAGTVDTLYVVCNDSGLLKACSTVGNIVTFQTLNEFILSSVCQPILRPTYAQDNLLVLSKSSVAIQPASSMAVQNDFINKLIGQTVVSQVIPEDNNEASIYMLNEPNNIVFNFEDMEYYGAGNIVIPFEATAEAVLNYAIFKADYFLMDDAEAKHISISELNNHYYDAEEEYTLLVEGTLSIEVDKDVFESSQLDAVKIEQLIDNADFEINSIDHIDIPNDNRRVDV